MSNEAVAQSPRDKIAALSDKRLKALAFRAWQIAQNQNHKKHKRALLLTPLFRAELKLRNLAAGH